MIYLGTSAQVVALTARSRMAGGHILHARTRRCLSTTCARGGEGRAGVRRHGREGCAGAARLRGGLEKGFVPAAKADFTMGARGVRARTNSNNAPNAARLRR